METSDSNFVFFECSDSHCGLRFPLDVKLFHGRFCPRCGAPLKRYDVGIKAQKPPAAPKPGFALIGALDNIRSAQNVGAIFRTADGAGLFELFLGGITPTPNEQQTISKTALGAEKCVRWSHYPNLVEKLAERKTDQCLILALESTPNAHSLQDFQFSYPIPKQVVLVIGNEPAGVDPAILNIADQVLYIPMCGEKTSLNVSVAFGVAIYRLLGL